MLAMAARLALLGVVVRQSLVSAKEIRRQVDGPVPVVGRVVVGAALQLEFAQPCVCPAFGLPQPLLHVGDLTQMITSPRDRRAASLPASSAFSSSARRKP